MEIKELFREYGEHKIYFGMYLDDCGTVYGGYAIDDNNIGVYSSLSTLFHMWNSVTGDDFNSSIPIDWSFYDDIIIEFLSSNHIINNVEGYLWEEIGLLCLQKLKEGKYLGTVGRKLLKYKELFPRSIKSIGESLVGQANAYGNMATSELVGANVEETIKYWIFFDERDRMRNIINGVKNKYLVVVKNPFLRDVQIAPNKYIEDISNSQQVSSIDFDWLDSDDGELAIGVYEGIIVDEALNEASKVWSIDKRALKGYELK